MTRGKVVLVAFPFDDLVSEKARPGLHVRSTVRAHRLLTVSSSLIKRELGSLSPQRQELVNQAVRRLFETAEAPEGSGRT